MPSEQRDAVATEAPAEKTADYNSASKVEANTLAETDSDSKGAEAEQPPIDIHGALVSTRGLDSGVVRILANVLESSGLWLSSPFCRASSCTHSTTR